LIPRAYLQAWSAKAPWPDLRQVEQDLMICRALCDLFSAPALRGKVAFRGGTAINKLLFQQPLRYSEDIDLVQMQLEPIGTTVDAIRDALAWLGKCNREQAGHSMHLVFKFVRTATCSTSGKGSNNWHWMPISWWPASIITLHSKVSPSRARRPNSTIKVRHHTPGYAPISESISWGKFGAIYPPNHAFPRQNRALSQIGVPSPKCHKYREKWTICRK
jgi:hypothetical protein